MSEVLFLTKKEKEIGKKNLEVECLIMKNWATLRKRRMTRVQIFSQKFNK